MKAILYIVAILVACGAIFFSYTFSQKFTTLQKTRLDTIADNHTVTSHAEATEKNLKDEKAKLAEAEEKRDQTIQRVNVLEATGASLKRESADWDSKLQTQKEQLQEMDKAMEEINKILGEMGSGVTLDNLGDKVAEVEADKKAKQESLDETTKKIEDTEKILATNRAESDRLTKRIVERNVHITNNAKEAVVTAVDQDWGFLVIGAGSNTGFTPQTSLIVMRDGRMIGRVRPSAIEPTQTIAEIDFKSLAVGARIMPGDRVMLTKPNAN